MIDNSPHQRYELPYAVLNIQGLHAKKFLQGQLTCDLEACNQKEVMFGAHCNPKGRVIFLFYLYQKDEHSYYLIIPHNMVTLTLGALKKYAPFYKISITDDSPNHFLYGISFAEKNALLIPQTLNRYISITEKKEETLPFLPYAAWHLLNIREGIPSLYPTTSGIFLPQELNLDKLNAISFTKGCYTGQEIIARLHYKGKLKQQMVHVKIHAISPILPNADIYTETKEAVGTIVDVVEIEYNNYECLVLINKAQIGAKQLFFKDQTPLFLE